MSKESDETEKPGEDDEVTLSISPHCLRQALSEVALGVKIPFTRGKTERPREPLLQLGTGLRACLCRIGGRH